MKYLETNQEKCLAELDFDQKQMFWIGWAQSVWCSEYYYVYPSGDYSGDFSGDYSGDYSSDYSGEYSGDYCGDTNREDQVIFSGFAS